VGVLAGFAAIAEARQQADPSVTLIAGRPVVSESVIQRAVARPTRGGRSGHSAARTTWAIEFSTPSAGLSVRSGCPDGAIVISWHRVVSRRALRDRQPSLGWETSGRPADPDGGRPGAGIISAVKSSRNVVLWNGNR